MRSAVAFHQHAKDIIAEHPRRQQGRIQERARHSTASLSAALFPVPPL